MTLIPIVAEACLREVKETVNVSDDDALQLKARFLNAISSILTPLELERNPVRSSNIQSVGYDDCFKRLEVEFKTGSIYEYYDVDPDVYEQLIAADSIGRALNQLVKKKFICRNRSRLISEDY